MSMPLNILVVDDSPVMRGMIIRTIGLSGIEVSEIHEAGNGREGLELLEKQWIDVLFMDVNMPVMNGIEMLDKIREQPALNDLPVMIISTESNEERIRAFREKGAVFIHKPFTPELLREKILATLEPTV
jgi:two-component system chemotaxis response regulator CheY